MHNLISNFLRDIRYAARSLWKSPGFAAAAVLTLALGIGANTAIFSMVQGVVLAPLPFDEPDRLVLLYERNLALKHGIYVSSPDFRDWQRDTKSFQQIAAGQRQDYDLTNPGTSAHVQGEEISAGFFRTLGVKLMLGRDFSALEDQHGGPPAVIISERLWRTRFAGSFGVLGEPVTLSGSGYTIAGVAPSAFHFYDDPDVYTPLGKATCCASMTARCIRSFSVSDV